MKTSAIRKSALREIRASFGRFAAILAIVAMGVGFFAGLKVSREAMTETAGGYLEKTEFFDYRLLSTLGFEREAAELLASEEGVKAAEGSVTADILYQNEEGTGGVIRAHSLTKEVNKVRVLHGRLPEAPDECAVDANLFGRDALGKRIILSGDNAQEDLDKFSQDAYSIVGIIQSPYYLQYERGTSSLGNGRADGFMYLPRSGFSLAYDTEVFVKFQEEFPLYSEEYEEFLNEKEPVWEGLAQRAGENRYEALLAEGKQELEDGRRELSDKKAEAKAELSKAEQELSEAEAELEKGKKELEKARKKLSDGERELKTRRKELLDGKAELSEKEAELLEGEAQLADAWEEWNDQSRTAEEGEKELLAAKEELEAKKEELLEKEKELIAGERALQKEAEGLLAGQKQLEEQAQAAAQELDRKEAELLAAFQGGLIPEEEYKQGLSAIEAGREALKQETEKQREELLAAQTKLDQALQELLAGKSVLLAGKAQLDAYQAQISEGMAQVEAGNDALAAAYMELQEAQTELMEGKEQLARGKEEILEGEKQLAEGEQELSEGRQELSDAQKKLSEGEKEYEDGLLEYQEALEEFETEIADAEEELSEGEQELLKLEPPDTYLLGRDTNVGYVCFENDSAIVDGIANIFPIFFLLVAALVCSTTMNRMVEEQRTQIGALKALGYSKATIMWKFLFYAGSAALAGSLGGFFGGTWLFPRVIWSAYGIMYRVEPLVYVFDGGLLALSLTAALLCTMGTAWLSCRYELSQVAAELMRPKAPRPGKRVFLERLPFIWRRLGFLRKVSVRNIFRYKKRLFMMVAGIGGCTALLVTGFGIKDSIANIAKWQFTEIETYDIKTVFSKKPEKEEAKKLQEALGDSLLGSLFLEESSMDLMAGEGKKAVNLIVAPPENQEKTEDYLRLETPKGEKLSYPKEGEAVITDKVAEELGISEGDTVFLQEEQGGRIEVRVSGISRNYVYNYAYINGDTYFGQLFKEPEYKTALLKLSEAADVHLAAAALMQLEETADVSVTRDVMERFESMMGSLDLIVVFIIICAGGLAFIVLYNLTNINITERVREIATIKVLGFYKKETAAYVFRENTVLALMGALVGLPLGCLLHRFVMSQIKIDMVAFDVRIQPQSYLYSAVLTILFAWLINRFMSGKLDKISMTESLKSVD